MMPLLLLGAAFGITAVVLMLLFWRYADQQVKQAYPEASPDALKKMLEDALEQQALLRARVEHLEAIVVSWDASDEDQPALPPVRAARQARCPVERGKSSPPGQATTFVMSTWREAGRQK